MPKRQHHKNLDKPHKELLNRIGKNLLKFRKERGWVQEDMSSFGFERRWYQRIESGEQSINLQTLLRLSVVFGVDVSELVKK